MQMLTEWNIWFYGASIVHDARQRAYKSDRIEIIAHVTISALSDNADSRNVINDFYEEEHSCM